MADSYDLSQASDPVKYWLAQIEASQKWHQDWYDRGKEVNEKYLDKRESASVTANTYSVNVLWSNVETIKPALYAKTPTPSVARRYRDKDPIGRWGAIVLERALDYQLDAYDMDYSIGQAVQDYLLPGRGQVWVHYEPTIANDGEPNQKVEWERCHTRHLNWKDFLTNPCRTFEEVWWGAQRAYYSRDEVEKRWGKVIADKLTFTDQKNDAPSAEEKGDKVPKAAIWEIWCKTTNLVYFASRNCSSLLEKPKAPFLNFEGFWPFPRPLMATTTTDKYLPTPDYCQYQNQAREIDLLSQRIGLMTKALRVVGIYDASQDSLGRLLEGTSANEMIPCENWAVLAAQKGLEGSVDFFPLDMIIKALQQCYESREQAKQVMYEITGISDIVRGASDPKETLGAQQIKTQWGGLRIRDKQKEVQRFVRDVLRLNSEIIAECFQLDTLKTMSNAPLLMVQEKQQLQQRKQMAAQIQQAAAQNPQLAQQAAQANPQLAQQVMQMAQPLSLDEEQALREPAWEEVFQLLRDEKLRCYRIGIETDSTIQADEAEEKAARTEFIAAFTSAITSLGPIAIQAPKFAPLVGEILLFGARGFKTAETLESAIEEAVDSLSQQALLPAPQQQAPPPDPKLEHDNAKLQFEQQKAQSDLQLRREEMQHEQQMGAQTRQHEQDMGAQTIQGEIIKAQATQPKPQDISAALAPLFEIVQQQMMALQQSNELGRQQLMQQQADGQAIMQQTISMLAQIASAPKEIKFKRGANNLIESGVARPVMQ